MEDWLEIYEVSTKGESSKVGRYCAKTAPGPIVSDAGVNMMKVILHTDHTGVAGGFSATYYFLKDVNKFGGRCYSLLKTSGAGVNMSIAP